MEEAFGLAGLKLHELTIQAAIWEHFRYDNSTERLVSIYQALELPFHEQIGNSDAAAVIDAYAYSSIMGQDRLAGDYPLRETLVVGG